jgi:hypothetical protein
LLSGVKNLLAADAKAPVTDLEIKLHNLRQEFCLPRGKSHARALSASLREITNSVTAREEEINIADIEMKRLNKEIDKQLKSLTVLEM